ncbi:MAG: hypothetical protein NTZ84_01235 [Candidatus Nealsonbacteria bacterium]|nr:hypothetical protein [Candidatus Nealsonbacteria bacterium]
MINLLPPENQKEIIQEQNWKMIIILGTLVLIFFICFSLIIFSVKIFVSGKVETQKLLLAEKEKELQASQIKSLESDIEGFNEIIFKLEVFYKNQFKITESLGKISTVFPSETYLNNLSINLQSNRDGVKQAICNISGFSSSRENLLKLKENMEKEESFKDIYFPPANWMKATSVNFTASFKFE